MPFEPIRTDEKRSGARRKRTDYESELMAGCMVILVVSLLVFGVSVVPFFAVDEYTREGLLRGILTGMLPASVLGVVSMRWFGAAGLSGFLGGALTVTVFLFLRLEQTMLGFYDINLPTPEYPERWKWFIPLAWALWAGILAVIFGRSGPIRRVRGDRSNR